MVKKDLNLGMKRELLSLLSGYSYKKEATENKSRQMSSLGCDEWTSYRIHPILGVQDVLLHVVRLGLHASDEYGQIIGLSPA